MKRYVIIVPGNPTFSLNTDGTVPDLRDSLVYDCDHEIDADSVLQDFMEISMQEQDSLDTINRSESPGWGMEMNIWSPSLQGDIYEAG